MSERRDTFRSQSSVRKSSVAAQQKSEKKGGKKKKKKNPMVLNHGSTMGTGLLTAPSGLYLNFFFACGAIFPFLLRKKGFDV